MQFFAGLQMTANESSGAAESFDLSGRPAPLGETAETT